MDRTEIDGIIDSCQVCRLGLSLDNQPYVVPLNFARSGDAVFFHCALEGKKLDIIRKNPKACLEFDIPGLFQDHESPCETGYSYSSVIASGRAELMESVPEKQEALRLLTLKFTGRNYSFSEDETAGVGVIRVTMEEVSGKRSD